MGDPLYRQLKDTCPPKSVSRFISDAVRAHLRPDRRALQTGYAAASHEGWRTELADTWEVVETEDWPE